LLLKDKNVILTGAGRGIGQVIAQLFAEEGANIALLSRTKEELEETLGLIKSKSPSSFIHIADISDEKQIKEAFTKIKSKFSSIEILINNAGVQGPIGKFHENNFQTWQQNIHINLFGTALLTHLVLPEMIRQMSGKIINMSGGGSTSPRPNFSAYAVSKTAIVRFTETLAEEYRDYNIDINAIAPGAINTQMLEEVIGAGLLAGLELSDAKKRKNKGGNDPHVAASLFSYLASDLSNGISGKLISAPWDPWENEEFQNELRNNGDLATLRRVDNRLVFRVEEN